MTGKPCVDCVAWAERSGQPVPKRKTDGAARTPRCATHVRQRRRAIKARTQENRDLNVYGLASGQFEQLYRHQGQVCAICRRATGRSRRLSVDHDHKTGLVRGLLCRPCNDLLGHLRDDPEAARRVVDYLLQTPAGELGIRAIHKDFREEEEPVGDEVRLLELQEAGHGDQESAIQESLERRW